MAVAIPLIAGGLGAWAGADIGIGAAAGWAIGSSLGSVVEQHFFGTPVPPNALTDLQVQTSSWGTGLPEVFGSQRLAGAIIWSTDKLLVGGQQGKWGGKGGGSSKGGGKGAGFGKKGTGSQGYYVVAIAFALSEGPIGGIKRIWAGGDLIFDDGAPVYVPSMDPSVPQGGYQTFTANNQPLISTGGSSLGQWTLYHGTSEQAVDPTIAANGSANGPEGVPYQLVTLANGFTYSYGSPQYGKMGTACAYRGVAYIVFPALNCGFGGTIPPLTFEVVGEPGTLNAPAITKAITYHPGGENISTGAVIDGGALLATAAWSSSHPWTDMQILASGLPRPLATVYNGWFGFAQLGSELVANNPSLGWYKTGSSGGAWSKICNTNYGVSGPGFILGSNVYFTGAYQGAWGLEVPTLPSGAVINGYQQATLITLQTAMVPTKGWNGYQGNGYPDAAVATSGFAIPVLDGSAYWFVGGVLWSFNGEIFNSHSTSLPAEPDLICSDGTYLWCAIHGAGEAYAIYKVSISGAVTSEFTINSDASVPALSQIIWANGWLYGLNSYYMIKYNPDGSTRYLTQLPLGKYTCNAVVIGSGLLILGATEAVFVSLGDTTLTPVPPTLPQVLTAICARAGFTAVDVSLVPALPVNLTRRAGNSARNVLKVLSQVYQMDMVDSAGTLRFVPKGQNISAQLGYDDIGFAKPITGGNAPSPYAWSRIQGTDLPRSVALKYTSALANYNPMQQFFQIQDGYGKDVAVSVPLTIDDRTALTAAMLLCVEPHIERTGYSWSCSFDWLALEAGDVVQMPWGVTRITQVDIRNAQTEPVLDFQGVIDASYVINSGDGTAAAVPVPQIGEPNAAQTPLAVTSSGDLIATQAQPTSIPGQIPTRPPISLGTAYAAFLEVPPLTSQDTTPAYLVAPWGTGTAFMGAAVYESTDGGTTFTEIAQQPTPGVVGWTPDALAATQPYTWDTTSSVSVYLNASYMQLSGATDLQVIQGANLAQLGSELIQFGNANLMTDANGNAYYQLTRLLRGRRGTESQMASHIAGESFVLIQANDETAVSYGLHDLNNAAEFKVATVGQSISAIPATDFAPTGLWYKPFSPAHVTTVSDSSGDWNVAFTPRARLNGWWGSGYSPSLDPDTQTWSADVYNGSTLKRTLSGQLTTPSFQYTAAMQSADGFTPGQHGIVFNIYQVGQIGRGYVNTVTT